MVSSRQTNYVSIIGFNYLDPIVELFDHLDELSPRGPNEVQSAPAENGLSSSIVTLTVLLVESAVARVKYDKHTPVPRGALAFMQFEFPKCPYLSILEEMFVIRDAIVHNHIWEAQFRWDDEAGMRLLAAELWEGSGDSKLDRVIDWTTRRTKILGLNLFPTRISRSDAITVFKNAVDVLLYLEEEGSQLINAHNQYLRVHGRDVSLQEYAALLSGKPFTA